ncbi:hypothetical protein [Nonomuraea sp. NPDC050310]|uniref:hypothetical protein n=1 Tax=unclassified Nonomuraea TaxID=2593643 RepID=UPI0033DFC7E9
MMRRLAAGALAAALGATVLATAAAPASAVTNPPYYDNGWHNGDFDYDHDGGYTRLSFDVNPEPAWAGRTLHLDGRLSVHCEGGYIDGVVQVIKSDWCERANGWNRLGGRKIIILFQPDGSHRWEFVDKVRTGGSGYFHLKVPAYTSGTFRAIYEGGRYYNGDEASDWVKVLHR